MNFLFFLVDPHAGALGPLGVGGFTWPAATAAGPEKIICDLGHGFWIPLLRDAILRKRVVFSQCRTYVRRVF